MIILLLAMQRSGSTEFCSDLCRPPLDRGCCLSEPFTFAGGEDYKADPMDFLQRRMSPNRTLHVAKLFDFNFDYAGRDNLTLTRLLHRRSDVCPVILERQSIRDRYCSHSAAMRTGDWSGHVHEGVHVHPKDCDVSKTDFPPFAHAHRRWYSWLTSRVVPHLYIDFTYATQRRPEALRDVWRWCAPEPN